MAQKHMFGRNELALLLCLTLPACASAQRPNAVAPIPSPSPRPTEQPIAPYSRDLPPGRCSFSSINDFPLLHPDARSYQADLLPHDGQIIQLDSSLFFILQAPKTRARFSVNLTGVSSFSHQLLLNCHESALKVWAEDLGKDSLLIDVDQRVAIRLYSRTGNQTRELTERFEFTELGGELININYP